MIMNEEEFGDIIRTFNIAYPYTCLVTCEIETTDNNLFVISFKTQYICECDLPLYERFKYYMVNEKGFHSTHVHIDPGNRKKLGVRIVCVYKSMGLKPDGS